MSWCRGELWKTAVTSECGQTMTCFMVLTSIIRLSLCHSSTPAYLRLRTRRCGLGRLPFEIARTGLSCQGNEFRCVQGSSRTRFSVFMCNAETHGVNNISTLTPAYTCSTQPTTSSTQLIKQKNSPFIHSVILFPISAQQRGQPGKFEYLMSCPPFKRD